MAGVSRVRIEGLSTVLYFFSFLKWGRGCGATSHTSWHPIPRVWSRAGVVGVGCGGGRSGGSSSSMGTVWPKWSGEEVGRWLDGFLPSVWSSDSLSEITCLAMVCDNRAWKSLEVGESTSRLGF